MTALKQYNTTITKTKKSLFSIFLNFGNFMRIKRLWEFWKFFQYSHSTKQCSLYRKHHDFIAEAFITGCFVRKKFWKISKSARKYDYDKEILACNFIAGVDFVDFAKFLRAAFLQNNYEGLFLRQTHTTKI